MRRSSVTDLAYVIHTRPYRETSVLVDFFTRDFGLIRGVVRGVRQSKSKKRGLVQAFVPLNIAWKGESGLVTITQLESVGMSYLFSGKRLISALYLNELIQKLMGEWQEYPSLFMDYTQAMDALANLNQDLQVILRDFELSFLNTLGYGVDCAATASGASIQGHAYYCDHMGEGWIETNATDHGAISGEIIIALGQKNWEDPAVLAIAKNLCRQRIAQQLGHRVLQTRALLQA